MAKLKNEHVAAQLLANLRTKIWLCAEDNYTARQAADLCGEIERRKVSRSRNETAKLSAFSFLDGEVIAADPGAVGEGVSISLRREHLFTPRAFTSLMVNQAIAKAFDGVRVLEPWVVYLKPMHENPEVSWFDTTGRVGPDTTLAPSTSKTLGALCSLSGCLRDALIRFGRKKKAEPGEKDPQGETAEAQHETEQGGAPNP